MAYQDNFSYSLDVESNVISLCPNCHKLLHHGTDEEKFDIIKILLSNRIERLKKANISISFNELKKCYS